MRDCTCGDNVKPFLSCAFQDGYGRSWNETAANGETLLPRKLEWNEVLELLCEVELLKHLPEEERVNLATNCMQHTFKPGDVLIRQGDKGDKLFVIAKGTVTVVVDNRTVGEMSTGAAVGERALLRDEPRAATIIAQTPLSVLGITREKFRALGLHEKLKFEKRAGIGPSLVAASYRKPPTKKSDSERKALKQALLNNVNLQAMVPLDDAMCNAMADHAWEETYHHEDKVITQGDAGSYFYVVKSGTFSVIVRGKKGETLFFDEVTVGSSFGELALIYGAPRAATVTAQDTATVWVIDRLTFKDIFEAEADKQANTFEESLNGSPFFDDLQSHQKVQVIKSMEDVYFEKEDVVYEEGEEGTAFFILYEGELTLSKNGIKVATLRAAKPVLFGELWNNAGEPRRATVTVTSETARALKMEKKAYDFLHKSMKSGKKKHGRTPGSKAAVSLSYTTYAAARDPNRAHIKMEEVTRIGILGSGGFGIVYLVEHKTKKTEYAMKALSRGFVQKSKTEELVLREKQIQLICNSEFIVKLYETYIDEQHLYFLMEMVRGGELFYIYRHNGLHGSVEHARYYTAGVVCAFDYMHGKHIMYRDLKPENLLLTEKGKLKVTDLGLAKITVGKTHTTCGTPCYFAPEMLEKRGYTHALDWWTLGILVFELMVGETPFGDGVEALPKIRKGIASVSFPFIIRGDCLDLVTGLCDSNPNMRLPMKQGGSGNIKSHPWYKGFQWQQLEEDDLDGPFIPQVKSREKIMAKKLRKEETPQQIPYVPVRQKNCGCFPRFDAQSKRPNMEEKFPTVK